MKLPADKTRCAGNSGTPDDDFNEGPLRNDCARHTDYFATHQPACQPVPRMYAIDPCNLLIPDTTYAIDSPA